MQGWVAAGVMLMFAWCASDATATGRPELVVPSDPDIVLERLPRGYAGLARPVSPDQPLERVNEMLSAAARTGDARLVTRAGRLVSGLPPQQPEVMKAQAYIAQYQHDFPTALRWLDAAVGADPRDGGARLARSQLHLVMGRLDLARSDCISLVVGIDSGRGQVCLAALALRRGNFNDAMRLTGRWLEQAPSQDPLRLHVLAMRAETAARAGAADTDEWMRQSLAFARGDVRALVPYARYLRKVGRERDAVSLIGQAPGSDSLQLQAALAAWSARLPDAAALSRSIESRYRFARTLGVVPELRDEAEFLLLVKGDAAGALQLAQRNFLTQRDHEDVRILLRSAAAAGRTDTLAPLRRWAASQGLDLPPASGDGP